MCRRLVCALLLPSLTLQAVAESHRIGCWGCWTCPFKDGITTGWDKPTQEIDLLRLYCMTYLSQSQYQSGHSKYTDSEICIDFHNSQVKPEPQQNPKLVARLFEAYL